MRAPVFAALASLAALALPQTASAAPGPTVEVDRTQAKIGDTVTVDLAAWPYGNVLIELCGNGGERGSADCAVAAAATTFVDAKGHGRAMVTVVRPPIGCPCVISARPVTGGRAYTAPLTVKGVPALSAAQRRAASATPARDLTVSAVRASGGGSLATWFGGPAERTITFTVRNTGTAPVADPPLTLSTGRAPEPTGIVEAPKIGTLNPGEQRRYTVHVRLPAPAYGRYLVVGELTGIDRPARFTARTSSYPWGLPALIALAAPVAALRQRRRSPGTPAPSPRLVTMNEIVAVNIGRWRRVRNLSPAALADALTSHTGTAWSGADVQDAEAFTPPRRFDADELLAFSLALDIPLPALLLPPTGYEAASAVAPAVAPAGRGDAGHADDRRPAQAP